MRIILAYTHIEPGVLAAIEESGYVPELYDVSWSDSAYWGILREAWQDGYLLGQDFATIEHDIRVNKKTLPSFDACDKPLCCSTYRYLGGVFTGLGATRFRSELMVAAPALMDDVGKKSRNGAEYYVEHPPKHWCQLAEWIGFFLRHYRLSDTCVHDQVTHLGDGMPSHECTMQQRMVKAKRMDEKEARKLADRNFPLNEEAARTYVDQLTTDA